MCGSESRDDVRLGEALGRQRAPAPATLTEPNVREGEKVLVCPAA
jgi:hypothetical protein